MLRALQRGLPRVAMQAGRGAMRQVPQAVATRLAQQALQAHREAAPSPEAPRPVRARSEVAPSQAGVGLVVAGRERPRAKAVLD